MNYREAGVRDIEDGKIEFEVLPEHVKLLRAARVVWSGDGVGAPMIDPKQPYGSTAWLGDINRIIDGFDHGYTPEQLHQFHKGTAVALAIAIKTGKWKPGTYRCDKYDYNWTEYRPKKVKNAPTESTGTDDIDNGIDDEGTVPLCNGAQPALDL